MSKVAGVFNTPISRVYFYIYQKRVEKLNNILVSINSGTADS